MNRINNNNNNKNKNIKNNNNNNINNINQNNNRQNQNQSQMSMLAFPHSCSLCNAAPLYQVMYYCKECRQIFCHRCEYYHGPKHPHPYFKIVNTMQYDFLTKGGKSNFDKFMDGVGKNLEGAYNSVLGFFGGGNRNNNNNNINNNNNNVNQMSGIQNNNNNVNQNQNNNGQRQPGPQQVSLVQIARNCYDLRNVTDQQIENALRQTNGNIDDAVILLVGQ